MRDQLQLQALAALVTLMDAGAAEALMLLRHFGGQDAIDAVTAASRGNVMALTAPEHASSIDLDDHGEIEPMTTDGLIERMSGALSATALRPDPRMLLSLRSAVGAVIDLLAELDRLQAALSTSARRDEASADRVLFSAAFARIYCERTAPSGAP